MGWREVRERYMKAGGTAQGTEDMLARRVLRAFGLNERTLPETERKLGVRDSHVHDDTTLFERARAVALRLGGKQCPSATFDCRTEKALLAEADELAENGVDAAFARVGGGKPVAVVSFAFDDTIFTDVLVTPCSMRRAASGRVFMICDAGDYVKWLYGEKDNELQ